MISGVKEKPSPPPVDPYGSSFQGTLSKILDNAILFLAPRWGLRRKSSRLRWALAQRQIDSLGASWTRRNDTRDSKWFASGLSIDTILQIDIEELHNRCAEVYRTNDVAHAAVEGRVSNEIGSGIRVQARVETDGESEVEINEALEASFERWSRYGVDVTRTMSIYEFQRLVCRSLGIYGEAIVLLSAVPSLSGIPLACELIAPERLSTPPERAADPTCRLGVQYDSTLTKILGYWIRTMHPGEHIGAYYEYKWNYYPRFDDDGQLRVLHVYEHSYAWQNRGIPWLAPALPHIKDLSDWVLAELTAKQVEACFGLIFTGGPSSVSPYDRAAGNASGDTVSASQRRLEEIQPGTIHYAAEDETVTVVDPNRPGSNFKPFAEHLLRSIAAAIDFPYEILAKDFFRTTFSSGQLAMLDGRHGFRTRRQLIEVGFLTPLWSRFVNEAVFSDEAGGTIDLLQYAAQPEFFDRSVWVAPGWGFINPRDEVRAAATSLDYNMTNLQTIYSANGQDAETELRKRQREKLLEVQHDVEQRKLQWELEEAAGLPHLEESQEPNDVESNSETTETESQSQGQPAS